MSAAPLDNLYLLPQAAQEAILNSPALQPPPGVHSNFDNPPNGNVISYVVASLLLTIGTTAFALAVYAKFIVRKVYFEDYIALAAYGLYVAKAYTVFGLITDGGLFIHQWDVRVKDLTTHQWFYSFGSEFYAFSIMFIKVAIILSGCGYSSHGEQETPSLLVDSLYRGHVLSSSIFSCSAGQIAHRDDKTWLCQALMWANVIFYITIVIIGTNACHPFAKFWDKTLRGHCKDKGTLDLVTAPVGFVSDVLILILPHGIIWRLHMSMRQKMGIALIFTIGLGACAASGYRISASAVYLLPDRLYSIGGLSITTDGEIVAGILVYCIPLLPVAFKGKKSPFRCFSAPFSRLARSRSTTATSGKGLLPTDPSFRSGYQENVGSMPVSEQMSWQAQPIPTPHRAILRTTQIQIDEEMGYGQPMPGQGYFANTGQYPQYNISGPLHGYDPYYVNSGPEVMISHGHVAR
ncbi:hypothetical protein GGS20DRAFT_587604 [Poronia punctata]|nr:hypothetical protein GGS20DRAFT_587604 [Poronia punctata]